MSWSDYLPVVVGVGSIVGGIICLQVFYTLWTPFAKKLSGDTLDVTKEIQISGLKDALVNVHFKSGSRLDNVKLVGYCSTHHEAPYDFRQLLILEEPNQKRYYARIAEIQYIEQISPL